MNRFIFVTAFAFLLAACSHSVEVTTDRSQEMPVVPDSDVEEMVVIEEDEVEESMDQTETKEQTSRSVMLHSVNWAFEPATIILKQGEDVTLHLMGIEGNHGIAIPGLGINQPMSEGANTMVKIPTDKPGTYEFFCNVSCGQGHKDMKGTIVIE